MEHSSTDQMLSVLIVDQTLVHKGVMSNAAFVLGLSAGRAMPDSYFGYAVKDGSGNEHRPLTNIGHFVRKAGQAKLRTLRDELAAMPGVVVHDYPEEAAPSDYSEYSKNMSTRAPGDITYRAIHIFGPAEAVAPRTKNLSRLE